MAVIKSSDLDFDQIKNNLKTYFEQQDAFKDYDFEASGLSNILDVLAYNTHLNGLIANFSINESFLASSQLRSSVLSHAETLGYYPKSKTASRATVQMQVNTTTGGVPAFITIPAFTKFTGAVGDTNYTFQTLENYNAFSDNVGVYKFQTDTGNYDIELVEGTRKTKTFLVGEVSDEQVYVIPDTNVDASTLAVKVYDTASSSTFTNYLNIDRVSRINANSRVYIIRETPNGYYELTFSGSGVLGLPPAAGNKIEVEYLTASGDAANGASVFTPTTTVTINNDEYNISMTTVSQSYGGSEKEAISSIKQNAIRGFATQKRMVTADDYVAQILQNYSTYVNDCTAWGGNDNVPPKYGVVYVSLNFKTGTTDQTKQIVKNNIVNDLTNNLSIMSISTLFEDPVDTFVEVRTTFNYDPNISSVSAKATEELISSTVADYFTDNLNTFDAVFRRSNILTDIDNLSPAILNSKMDVKIQQRFTPTLNAALDYNVYFPTIIAEPDDKNYIISTSRFTFNNQTVYLRNSLNSNKLEIVNLLGDILNPNAGSYDRITGALTIRNFNISGYEGESIKVSATPANQSTIKPLRNYILRLDPALSFSSATLDYQTTSVAIGV